VINRPIFQEVNHLLSDPQVVTVNAVAKSMPKILSDGQHSIYQLSDKSFTLDIRHNSFVRDKKSRIKSLATFTQRAVVADPLTAVNDYETLTVSVQIDRPEAGFTMTQTEQLVAGFQTWLNASMVDKLFGQES
jgi:hypothetical protein